jgi:hypothetical protein
MLWHLGGALLAFTTAGWAALRYITHASSGTLAHSRAAGSPATRRLLARRLPCCTALPAVNPKNYKKGEQSTTVVCIGDSHTHGRAAGTVIQPKVTCLLASALPRPDRRSCVSKLCRHARPRIARARIRERRRELTAGNPPPTTASAPPSLPPAPPRPLTTASLWSGRIGRCGTCASGSARSWRVNQTF